MEQLYFDMNSFEWDPAEIEKRALERLADLPERLKELERARFVSWEALHIRIGPPYS